MKILALDFGEQKIGIALGNTKIGIAAARDFLENNSKILETLAELIEQENIEKILIGLPLGLSGKTQQTERTHNFAKELETKISVSIELVDERFTSRIAEANLRAAGKNSRKQKNLIDSESARIILQEYFDKINPRDISGINASGKNF